MSIKKIFIANRAEIATRIIRTCERLGIQTVATASLEDLSLPYTRDTTQLHVMGAHTAAETFLDPQRMLELAKHYGCDALHPGFGFLSENADFAEMVTASSITFIGPNAQAMRVLGSKTAAKALARKHAVPVLPELAIDNVTHKKSVAAAQTFFDQQGGSVLIKAAGGGGGRGMRPVQRREDIATLLENASREAKKFFGDERVFLERRIDGARHLEVQIFGDTHGNARHLFERDCSFQRRHQKVIEEAPAPNISDALREELHRHAVTLATALSYDNAGTAEFLLAESGELFFLEVNSRLQVEHPVTEELLGIDLVEWQILAAAGESLATRFSAIENNLPTRHVIEVRVCAEDPSNGFTPAQGPLASILLSDKTRNDFGYKSGSWVGGEYDSMLGKVIASAPTRSEAIALLQSALKESLIAGIPTNISFAQFLLSSPEYTDIQMRIDSIDSNLGQRFVGQRSERLRSFLVAAACHFFGQSLSAADSLKRFGICRVLSFEGQSFLTRFAPQGSNVAVSVIEGFEQRDVLRVTNMRLDSNRDQHALYRAQIENEIFEGVIFTGSQGLLCCADALGCFHGLVSAPILREQSGSSSQKNNGVVSAELPGRVLETRLKSGSPVAAGDVVMVLESMKMELPILAGTDGVVQGLDCKVGDSIRAGQTLFSVQVQ
jgi:acetyl/propionyl-CoA carboxylase alpha subunit